MKAIILFAISLSLTSCTSINFSLKFSKMVPVNKTDHILTGPLIRCLDASPDIKLHLS